MELLSGNKVLTKRQCDVLRGIAIMGIFLHNFCHWLHGGHHENEYLFFKEHSMRMWDYWNNVFSGNFDGFEFIQFFSFFGHYGVPLFLFLSGFGLVMKYEREGVAKKAKIRGEVSFIRKKVKKRKKRKVVKREDNEKKATTPKKKAAKKPQKKAENQAKKKKKKADDD